MSSIDTRIGLFLRQSRDDSRLTLREAGDRLGVRWGNIGKWERAENPIKPEYMDALLNLYGRTWHDWADFVEGDGPALSSPSDEDGPHIAELLEVRLGRIESQLADLRQSKNED